MIKFRLKRNEVLLMINCSATEEMKFQRRGYACRQEVFFSLQILRLFFKLIPADRNFHTTVFWISFSCRWVWKRHFEDWQFIQMDRGGVP
jgi:hypothetical protein